MTVATILSYQWEHAPEARDHGPNQESHDVDVDTMLITRTITFLLLLLLLLSLMVLLVVVVLWQRVGAM